MGEEDIPYLAETALSPRIVYLTSTEEGEMLQDDEKKKRGH